MNIGIDIGGSHIGIGIVNENYQIVKKYEKDFTEEDKKNAKKIIEDYIINTVKKIEEEYEIESIGIAIPGTSKDGIIVRTVNIDLDNYNIKKELEKKLNKRITVKNDGKCACIAEYSNLVKNEKYLIDKTMLFLNIGTGIGGGIIYNGNLLKSNKYEGFEMGHVVIKENGLKCKCGNYGCFEQYGSILNFKNKVKERLNIDKNINGDELRNIMDQRNEEIKDLKEEYIKDLAIGISNYINIFEPDIIVIGGGFIHFSYMFMNELKNKILNSNSLFNRRDDIDIRIANLGNDAGIIGSTM